MTVHIDRITLRLPPGSTGRAAAIARRIAAELAQAPNRPRACDLIRVPPLTAQRGWSDGDIAGAVARAMGRVGDRS